MAERTLDERQPSVLDRTIDLTAVSWSTIAWIAAATLAVVLPTRRAAATDAALVLRDS